MGIAAVHNFDKEGVASIAHTDITPGQFVLVDGVYKLNDFNRARFIRWSREEDRPCGYYVGKNPGKVCSMRSHKARFRSATLTTLRCHNYQNRSPEEYKYEEQTEKVSGPQPV